TRLASLTRRLAGEDRPKQFCRLIGDDTLLEQTRRRARLLIAPEGLLTVVTRHHERFCRPALADAPPRSIVVQPENRGTAPAGCVWHCFVMVARPSTLEQLIRRATPELYEAFAPLRARLGTPWEEETARAVYGRLPSTDLSRHVFQACAESLAVLPVSGVGWTDLGDPVRVHEAQARLSWQPATA